VQLVIARTRKLEEEGFWFSTLDIRGTFVSLVGFYSYIYITILTEPQPDHNLLTLFLLFKRLDNVKK